MREQDTGSSKLVDVGSNPTMIKLLLSIPKTDKWLSRGEGFNLVVTTLLPVFVFAGEQGFEISYDHQDWWDGVLTVASEKAAVALRLRFPELFPLGDDG